MKSTRISSAEMYRAVRQRDRSYVGLFVLAVKTTGVFCRPACPAKLPRRENIEFFKTPGDALAAGYRPCLRCRPLSMDGAEPDWVSRLMKHLDHGADARIRDVDLASLDVDPIRARRYFRSHYGMTFQTYHRSLRLGRAMVDLGHGQDPLTVSLKHGFESYSGFQSAFAKTFGLPPSRAVDRGVIVSSRVSTPLGSMAVGATEHGICLLEFADRRALKTQIKSVSDRFNAVLVPGNNDWIRRLRDELARYFDTRLSQFTVPLEMKGTPFQESVWRQLLTIPAGTTRAYEEIAASIGRPNASRAVGRANGQNPLAILVPCHRVVHKSGHLQGYGGGIWRKQFLLNLERTAMALRRGVPAVGIRRDRIATPVTTE